jgi:hypothetical protein
MTDIIAARRFARLIAADYDGQLGEPALHQDGLTVTLTADGEAIARGSNDRRDWMLNLSIWPSRSTIGQGVSGAMYHWGFLEPARQVYAWAKAAKPRVLLGHSRGAAVASIVGASLKIPTVAFACPRPLWLSGGFEDAESFVTVYNRSDDLIARLPPWWLGYRHIGDVRWAKHPAVRHAGEDHRIMHYIDALEEGLFD